MAGFRPYALGAAASTTLLTAVLIAFLSTASIFAPTTFPSLELPGLSKVPQIDLPPAESSRSAADDASSSASPLTKPSPPLSPVDDRPRGSAPAGHEPRRARGESVPGRVGAAYHGSRGPRHATPTADGGAGFTPPGLAPSGTTPPGLAQGGAPPGLAPHGDGRPGFGHRGTPPGLARPGPAHRGH